MTCPASLSSSLTLEIIFHVDKKHKRFSIHIFKSGDAHLRGAFPLLGSNFRFAAPRTVVALPLSSPSPNFSIGYRIWIVESGENRSKSQRISRKGGLAQVLDCCPIHRKFSWLIAAPSHIILLEICVQFSSGT